VSDQPVIPTVTVEGAPVATVQQTPSQAIVQDANRIEYGTDARGRRIGVRRINISVRRRVLKALSAESGMKPGYVNMAMMAASCVELNGEPISFPDSEIKIDGLIERLDDDGFEAIGDLIGKFAPKKDDDVKN